MLLLAAPGLAPASMVLDEEGKAVLSADFRVRLESDWDSQRANGVERDDRTRLRIRVRLGLTLEPVEGLELGLRLRSGDEANHQSPHITAIDFDGNDTGRADFNFDRWYVKGSLGRAWAWIGRNSVPLWRPDEILADDDAIPAGVALGSAWDWEASELTVSAGYFSLPVGMREFTGNLGTGEVRYERQTGGSGFTLAGAFLDFEADPEDPDAATLLNGNGFRDYEVWVGSGQLRRKVGDLPLAFTGSYLYNAEGYSPDDPDPFTAANFDQTEGWLLAAQAGSLGSKGEWLAAYFYARIETLAVNSSYAQDDWVRWGSATEVRATNMKGHELRFGYAFSKVANLLARLYIADAITTIEDGKRFRLDFNYSF